MKALLPLVLLAIPVWATQQEPDIIYYNDTPSELETSWLFPSPMEVYFRAQSLPQPYEGTSTGNYRGHIATWKVDGDVLYLTRIEPEAKDPSEEHSKPSPDQIEQRSREEIKRLFPDKVDANGEVAADWFSGNLRVFTDPITRTYKTPDDPEGYELPGYATVVLLQVENGKVIRQTAFPFEEYWRKFEIAQAYRNLPLAEKEAIADHLAFLDQADPEWEAIGKLERPAQLAQDSGVFLTRYITAPEDIPLTKCVIVKDVAVAPKASGWIIDSDLRIFKESDLLMIEMNSTDVPDGPWNPYTGGSVQIVIPISKDEHEITVENGKPDNIHVIDNFLRKEKDSQELAGTLKLTPSAENTTINGTLRLTAAEPISRQEIVFEDAHIPILDLKTYLETFHPSGEEEAFDVSQTLKRIQELSAKESGASD